MKITYHRSTSENSVTSNHYFFGVEIIADEQSKADAVLEALKEQLGEEFIEADYDGGDGMVNAALACDRGDFLNKKDAEKTFRAAIRAIK
jgi:hypothetical protein